MSLFGFFQSSLNKVLAVGYLKFNKTAQLKVRNIRKFIALYIEYLGHLKE